VNPIVFSDSTTPDDIDDAAHAGGWVLLNILPATEQHPAQRIFMAPDRESFIHIVEDARLGPPYAVVQGAGAERWEADVRARLLGEAP
jgi:hypothetical protein